MRIRLYHARILTMLENDPVFFGEVWVNKDRIERVIPEDTPVALSEERFDQQIDCMGNLLIPGFKNCHAHGPMTFLRSYADDMQLQDWLNQKIFPAEARLQEEDVYTLMQLAVLEYIRGGITTSFEMYFHPPFSTTFLQTALCFLSSICSHSPLPKACTLHLYE